MTNERGSKILFGVSNEPAAMKQSSPTTTPSSSVLPMPTKQWLPTVQPCSVTRWPTVHSRPMVVFETPNVACPMLPS